MGSRRFLSHTGRSSSTAGRTFARGWEATWAQQTAENGNIADPGTRSLRVNTSAKYVLWFSIIPEMLLLHYLMNFFWGGRHLAAVYGLHQQHSNVNFPGCGQHSAIAWWDPPQRGRMGQSCSPSEVRGQGKWPHLRQNSGERYNLGLSHGQCKSREWMKAEDKGRVRDCWSRRREFQY